MLQDYASVEPNTVEPQHHNAHNHKVYIIVPQFTLHQDYTAQYKYTQNETHGIAQENWYVW